MPQRCDRVRDQRPDGTDGGVNGAPGDALKSDASRDTLRCIAPPARECVLKAIPALSLALALALCCGSGTAVASAELAREKNCAACHAPDKKLIGPAYRSIAAKYASERNAVARLTKKVREGGVGVWGPVPMPANPQVSEDEAQALVKWVLQQR